MGGGGPAHVLPPGAGAPPRRGRRGRCSPAAARSATSGRPRRRCAAAPPGLPRPPRTSSCRRRSASGRPSPRGGAAACRAPAPLAPRARPSDVAIARDELGVDATLCPDMAWFLDLPPAPRTSGRVLWLLREDQESTRGTPGTLRPWAAPPPSTGPRRGAARPAGRSASSRPRSLRWPLPDADVGTLVRRWDAAEGRARLDAGLPLLSGASLVVTDRLHAHILALLLGIPTVVLPEANGKLPGLPRGVDRVVRRRDLVRDPGRSPGGRGGIAAGLSSSHPGRAVGCDALHRSSCCSPAPDAPRRRLATTSRLPRTLGPSCSSTGSGRARARRRRRASGSGSCSPRRERSSATSSTR